MLKVIQNAWANPYLGGGNDLKYIKKGIFPKSCLTDDERRHPLLEHGHPVHAVQGWGYPHVLKGKGKRERGGEVVRGRAFFSRAFFPSSPFQVKGA